MIDFKPQVRTHTLLRACMMLLVLMVTLPESARAEDDLMVAARTGNLAMAKKAVRRGSDVNRIGKYGDTPLHVAARSTSVEVLRFLVENGGSLEVRNDSDRTPLAAAVANGNTAAVEYLIGAGANKGGALVSLAGANASLIAVLARLGVDVNAPDASNSTALHQRVEQTYAASFSRDTSGRQNWEAIIAAIDALLANGADPNAKNGKGQTPLHTAARIGVAEVAERLIAAGADPNARDSNGKTPIEIASGLGNQAMVALLGQTGANPNTDSMLLFEAAYWADAARRLRPLLDAGADANAVTEICSQRPCKSPNAAGAQQMSILQYVVALTYWSDRKSAQRGLELVRMLLEAGADPNYGAPRSVLRVAVGATNPELVRLLLEYDAVLEGFDESSAEGSAANALYLPHAPYRLPSSYRDGYDDVRRRGKREIVAAFLRAGADPDEVNPRTGETPLFLAVTNGDLGIVRMLIAAGADVSRRDASGASVLERAMKSYNPGLIRAVCSRPGRDCDNTRRHVRDRRTAIKELVIAGAEPTQNVGEAVRRAMGHARARARTAQSEADYRAVIREYDKARDAEPLWGPIYYNIGAVYEAAGNYPEALANFELYLALTPGAENAREVQDEIYELEVSAESYVGPRDVFAMFKSLHEPDQWRMEGEAAYFHGKFTEDGRGLVLNSRQGVTRGVASIPVKVSGRTVSWKSTYFWCGPKVHYSQCPIRMTNVCTVASIDRIDCTVDYFNDWQGFAGEGRTSKTEFSWLRNR